MTIPRRLAVGPNMSQAERDLAPKLTFYLDGKEVDKVVCYDVDMGMVTRYKTDKDGHLIVDKRLGAFEAEVLTGHVEVRHPELPSISTPQVAD